MKFSHYFFSEIFALFFSRNFRIFSQNFRIFSQNFRIFSRSFRKFSRNFRILYLRQVYFYSVQIYGGLFTNIADILVEWWISKDRIRTKINSWIACYRHVSDKMMTIRLPLHTKNTLKLELLKLLNLLGWRRYFGEFYMCQQSTRGLFMIQAVKISVWFLRSQEGWGIIIKGSVREKWKGIGLMQ